MLKTHIAITFGHPYLNSFVFTVLFKCSITVLSGYFILTEFDAHFPCLNLAKIRDTVSLNSQKTLNDCEEESRLFENDLNRYIFQANRKRK